MQAAPTLKERQRTRRNEEILDAAASLFADRGFSAVRFEEVASAAYISKPTLYAHFRSKEDLAVGLALREMRRVSEFLDAQDSYRPAIERLDAFITWTIEFRYGGHSGFLVTLMQFVRPLRLMGSALEEAEEEVLNRISALVDEAQRERSVRKDVKPFCVAAVMMSAYHGFLDHQISAGTLTLADITQTWIALLTAPK